MTVAISIWPKFHSASATITIAHITFFPANHILDLAHDLTSI